jgi:hypothetical protein
VHPGGFAGLPPWQPVIPPADPWAHILTLTVILIPQSFPRIAVTSGLVVRCLLI